MNLTEGPKLIYIALTFWFIVYLLLFFFLAVIILIFGLDICVVMCNNFNIFITCCLYWQVSRWSAHALRFCQVWIRNWYPCNIYLYLWNAIAVSFGSNISYEFVFSLHYMVLSLYDLMLSIYGIVFIYI